VTKNSGIIVDAGPALTFLARNDTTKALLQGLRGLSPEPGFAAPETVRDEVMRKSSQKRELRAAASKWTILENANRIEILPDDETEELSIAVQRLSNMPMTERLTQRKDLGEIMVIAHASVLADAGHPVTILIEERDGTALARKEAARFTRMPPSRGRIQVLNTEQVLLRAIDSPEIPDKATMKAPYNAMRPLDAALPPLEQTSLLTSARWNQVR
jgi:hypothetical protein